MIAEKLLVVKKMQHYEGWFALGLFMHNLWMC